MKGEALRTEPVAGFDPYAERNKALDWYRQQRELEALGQTAVETESVEEDWHLKAACRGSNPDLFFPINFRDLAGKEQTEEAKEVCRSCPVQKPCNEEYGNDKLSVRGNSTPGERKPRKPKKTKKTEGDVAEEDAA